MNSNIAIALVVVSYISACASVPSATSSDGTWSAGTTTDPITGVSRCVVAAYDQFGSREYTRTGSLYPIVEKNSQFGVLVGVSSGGRFRMPVGDIVWRIDEKPYRTLRQIDNPTQNSTKVVTPKHATPVEKAMNDALTFSQKFAQTVTATATMASGAQAREMIAEMRSGKGLIFRVAAAAPAYGLPSSSPFQVGQYRGGDLTPIPLDESFHHALADCGI